VSLAPETILDANLVVKERKGESDDIKRRYRSDTSIRARRQWQEGRDGDLYALRLCVRGGWRLRAC